MTPHCPLDAWVAGRAGLTALDSAALAAWQLAALRRSVLWARLKSPFYRKRLEGLPQDFPASFADLAHLPLLTSQDLRLQAERMLCVSQDAVARVVTLNTSGTTGSPKRIFLTEQDLDATLDFFRIGMTMLARPGDTVFILLPGRRPDGAADLLGRAVRMMEARPVFAPAKAAPDELLRSIMREEIACLAALPSQIASLLEEPDAMSLGRGILRSILLSGEPVPEALRSRAQDLWGAEIFAHYGLTETGFGAAVECPAHAGYHLREADLYVEIVDPKGGLPLPAGEPGEVVVSTLRRGGMPLLRYRTGDFSRLLPGPCACGSPLRRLGLVEGRIKRTAIGVRIEQPVKGAAQREQPAFNAQ